MPADPECVVSGGGPLLEDCRTAPDLHEDEGLSEPPPPPPPPPPPATQVRRLSSCLRSFFTHLFSNVGLFTLVGGYVLLGALLFESLEGGYEMNQRGNMKEHRDDCLKELWALTERFNVLYQENWTQQAQEQLRRFETRVVEATKVEGYDGKDPQDKDRQWSFSGALLYSVTVITTIGYGNLAPRTPEGKVVTMLYALVGVPLMLLCLSNLGSFLADTFQFAYSHACCKPCRSPERGKQAASIRLNHVKHVNHNGNQQRVGYSGFGDGSVSLGAPGSIGGPPPPPSACGGGGGGGGGGGPVACGPGCTVAATLGYSSSTGSLPRKSSLSGETRGGWGGPWGSACHEQPVVHHNTVVKTANSGAVVTRLQNNKHHITPDVHRLLTECVEYQVMQDEPGAAAALRELQSQPPCGPACPACPTCPACPACPAQHHDGLGALEEEPEEEDDEDDHHHGDRGCGPHSTPSRVPLLCRSSSVPGEAGAAAAAGVGLSTPPLKRNGPPPPPRRCTAPLLTSTPSVSLSESSEPPGDAAPPPPYPPPSPPPAPRVPIYLVLAGLAAYICLGAAVFAAWEEWSFLDGAYFCFVTLSTIGFGDLVPGKSLKSAESQGGQLQVSACVAYLLLGLVLIATAFSLVQEEVLARLSQVARTLGIISKHHQQPLPLRHGLLRHQQSNLYSRRRSDPT